jgi:tRNA1Val (adenine37-N6)-methyltransferase
LPSGQESIHDLFGYDGIKIIQRDDLTSFSVDSVLLADFVTIPKRVERILDLGCGNAPIPLYLSLKTKKPIIGVELQKTAVDLARRSVLLNHLENQITILEADIKTLHERFDSSFFDLIVSNPPFFQVHANSPLNNLEQLTIARHEVAIDLETLFLQAKRLLSTGGNFVLVHRVERLEEIIVLSHRHHLAVKRLRFVYPKRGLDAILVLVETRNNSRPGGLTLEEPFYVMEADGTYTPEMKRIHFFGKK